MKRRNKPRGSRRNAPADPQIDRIFGVHAVRAALANPRREILSLQGTENGLDRIADLAGNCPASPVKTTPQELSRMLGSETVHQGVVAEARPLSSPALDEALADLGADAPLIVLDQVTDPHNVGAILRSAAAFNAAAVVMTRRNSPPLDGTLAKSASGAVEHVPVVLVANLARALEEMRRSGVLRVGLDGGADQTLETLEIAGPCALVLGSEHKGLRRLTAEHCDVLCRLTTTGALNSLNVSNAAAVALHTLATRSRN